MIQLAENLKQYRKNINFTQEQLAEVFGVTTGAVYKWENNLSIPDINTLIDLAKFYNVSVDALLGYQIQESSVEAIIEHLKNTYRNKNYTTLELEAEKAISKYPNHFLVCYECALAYRIAGLETTENRFYNRAYALYERALLLFDQNKNPEISAQILKKRMAEILFETGEVDKAVEKMKEINQDGIYDGAIGLMLSNGENSKEALKYLSKGFIKSVFGDLSQIAIGSVSALCKLEKREEAVEILEWYAHWVRSLRPDAKVTYLDKLESYLLAFTVDIYLTLNKAELAKDRLQRAYQLIITYEMQPSYSITDSIKFFNEGEMDWAYDSLGNTREKMLETLLSQAVNKKELQILWEEIVNEK